MTVAEVRASGPVPLWRHPGWAERFPWLAQGTTGAGDGDDPFDLGLYGEVPVGVAVARWRRLREAAGMRSVVHARQVHGAEVHRHDGPLPPGLVVMEGFDGHVSAAPAVLLAVSVADCVPVSLIDPRRKMVALLHAGWRGAAGGILERALQVLGEGGRSSPEELWMHCGPAICGGCYEVGPEVHAAVHPDRAPPATPTPIDLRAALAERAARAGIPADQCTVSAHCTRCGPGTFFSHRGGSAARQMGVLGIAG